MPQWPNFEKYDTVVFDPTESDYLKSLGVVAAIPILILIVLVAFMALYLCLKCCCCNTHSYKNERPKQVFLKTTIVLCVLVSLAGIGVCFYGSSKGHSGVSTINDVIKDMINLFDEVLGQLFSFVNNLLPDVENVLTKIPDVADLQHDIRVILKSSKYDMSDAQVDMVFQELARRGVDFEMIKNRVKAAKDGAEESIKMAADLMVKVNETVEPIRDEIHKAPGWVEDGERYRQIAVYISLSFLILIALLWLVSVFCCRNKCLIYLINLFAFVVMVVAWLLAAVFGTVAVAGSDACINFLPFLHEQLSSMDDNLLTVAVDYYVDCRDDAENIFEKDYFKEAERQLEILDQQGLLIKTYFSQIPDRIRLNYAGYHINEVVNIDRSIVGDIETLLNVTRLQGVIDDAREFTNCTRINKDYTNTMTALCNDIMECFTLIFFAAGVIGISFAYTIIAITHVNTGSKPTESGISYVVNSPPPTTVVHINATAAASTLGHMAEPKFQQSSPVYVPTPDYELGPSAPPPDYDDTPTKKRY